MRVTSSKHIPQKIFFNSISLCLVCFIRSTILSLLGKDKYIVKTVSNMPISVTITPINVSIFCASNSIIDFFINHFKNTAIIAGNIIYEYSLNIFLFFS